MPVDAKITKAEIQYDEGVTDEFHVVLSGKETETGNPVQVTFDMLLASLDDEVALLDGATTADPTIAWV